MPTEAESKKFKTALAEYRRAERAIRRNERLILALPLPPINQLRYAGYHLAKAGSPAKFVKVEEELDHAICHCKRAWFDAFDDIVVKLLEFYRDFREKNYPEEAIIHYYPEYSQVRDEVVQIVERMRAPAYVQSMSKERAVFLLRDARRLARIRQKLIGVDSRLSNIIQLRQNYEKKVVLKRQALQFLVSLLVSISGTVIGGFGLVLTLKQYGASSLFYLLVGAVILLFSWVLYEWLGKLIFGSDWGNIE